MKLLHSLSALLFSVMVVSCGGQAAEAGRQSLQAKDFNEKIQSIGNAQIIDVRTPEEYQEGHIPGAKNINWTAGDFANLMSQFSKDKPVMVYCLSGGRSGEAAEQLATMGFSSIYELQGGMMNWRAEHMDVEATGSPDKGNEGGMKKADYDKATTAQKYVLVDFYADWCKPCKQMEPMLKTFADTHNDSVDVLRINADDNAELSQLLAVEALPSLFLYKNGKMVWQKVGLTTQQDLEKAIHE